MTRTFILIFAAAIALPGVARAQYSKNATPRAQQGVFLYRPTTPSGNFAIQPRGNPSPQSQQGLFLYRPNGFNGNLVAPQGAVFSNRSRQGAFIYRDAGIANLAPQQPQLAANTVQEGTGTIDRVNLNALVVRANGELWTVRPEGDATIEVVGEATRDFLKAGQYVKFNGNFDAEHNSLEPLSHLAVVSLKRGDKAGVTELAETSDAAAKFLDKYSAETAAAAPKSVAVLGRINNVLGNQLTVGTGSDVYKVDVASDARINVRTADLGLAQPGDKISVKGYAVKPGVAQASAIEIQLSKPARGKKVTP